MTQAESELEKIVQRYTDYCECEEWHIHDGSGEREGSTPKDAHYNFDQDQVTQAILALITDQVREELKKIEQIGADPKFDTPAHLAPIYSVRAYIKDRLAQLTEKGKEDERFTRQHN